MQEARKHQLNILSVIVGLAMIPFHTFAGSANFDLKTFRQYSRIVIPALPATSITATENGNAIVIDMSRAMDLTKFDLAGLKDSRIKDISLKVKASDQAEVKISLNSQHSDFFAYAQPDPAAIIVDIWQKKADENLIVAAVEKKKSRSPASVKAEKKEPEIKILPLNDETDLFVKMVVPVPALELKGGIIEVPVKLNIAENWKFATPNKKEPDGEAYALAQTLYKDKKYGLTIRTVELLRRDYPKSTYLQEAEFLRALALKQLGHEQKSSILVEQAEHSLLEQATKVDESGKNAPFYRVIHFYFAMKDFQGENWFKAVERFEYLLSIWNKKDPEYIKLQMLMAEAYIKVQRPRFAERIYRYILENQSNHPLAAEAAYRIGDLLATEKNYDRTIDEGLRALSLYPNYKKNRSELLFNIGEAYFWKKNYKNSIKFFKEFVAISPAATIAAQAHARMGEIEEVFRGDLKAAEESYMRAKNGFPFTFGDQLASLRLARLRITTESDLSYQISSLETVYQNREATDTVRRLAQLVLIDYYIAANKVDRAVETAREGFVANTGTAYEAFKKSYSRSLLQQINDRNNRERYSEALKIYDQNQSLLTLNGPKMFLSIATTYRGLGLFETSNQYLANYETELRAGRVVAAANERNQIREERAENAFRRGDYQSVLEEVKSADDTAHASAMRSIALYRTGKKNDAYREAKRAFSALEAARPKLEKNIFNQWYPAVADLLVEEAINDREYETLEKLVNSARKNFYEPLERYEFFAGDSFWYRRDNEKAIAAYKQAIEKFPNGERADRARYNSAMSLIALKRRDEAVKLLTEVKEKQRVVWSDAAKQELDLLEWEKKYAAVLRGLPPSGLGVVQ